MRVFISADLEGVNGVVLRDHVEMDGKAYAHAREWMTREVNAAIAGAFEAGVKEVVVNDSHNQMINLLLDRLDPRANLISGTGKPFSMVQGLDGTFDAAFFLGYHAKIGTMGAVHDHTYAYSLLHDVRMNGISVGEFGLNAGYAGHYHVPSVLVTGDEAVVAEAKKLINEIETVAVKKGLGRYSAYCYPFEEKVGEIQLTASRALQSVQQKRPLVFDSPYKLEVEFQKTEFADLAATLKGVKRMDGFTVSYESSDYPELYEVFLTMLRICW